MVENSTKCACGANSDCCAPKTKKQIVIDFLYLDLHTCDRCCETEKTLSEALLSVKEVLDAAGIETKINHYLIETKEDAIKHAFLASPTIRINGNDIDVNIKESQCKTCGDLCGDDVDCRVWNYQGTEYTVPPKTLIVDALLREVYAPRARVENFDYQLPSNLEKYFDALSKKSAR